MGLFLHQWKVQMTRDNFDQFIMLLCENLAKSFENMVLSKKFHQYGAILLDKEIRNIISFFQNITSNNVKTCFSRLSLICDIMMLEN
jgi:hypothetical protein